MRRWVHLHIILDICDSPACRSYLALLLPWFPRGVGLPASPSASAHLQHLLPPAPKAAAACARAGQHRMQIAPTRPLHPRPDALPRIPAPWSSGLLRLSHSCRQPRRALRPAFAPSMANVGSAPSSARRFISGSAPRPGQLRHPLRPLCSRLQFPLCCGWLRHSLLRLPGRPPTYRPSCPYQEKKKRKEKRKRWG
jgi:hypothetical protein